MSIDVSFLRSVVKDFAALDAPTLRSKYKLPKDGRDWTIEKAKNDILSGKGEIIPFLYKPFDLRYTYYSGTTKGFVAYPRRNVMQHIVGRKNVALICNRQSVRDYFSFACVTQIMNNHGTFYLGNRGQDYCCPLYLYPDENAHKDERRRPNFDEKLYAKLRKLAGNRPKKDSETKEEDDFAGAPPGEEANEIDVFDYIYGVLHCPAYRETYADFLKTDFPRIPWPKAPEDFWSVCKIGKQLRSLHLMEDATIGETPFPFETEEGEEGENIVEKPTFKKGRVYINKTQYFDEVPEISWGLYIGGYQPAQKWLKDRKGRELSFDEIRHYQKIIKILAETDRIMKTIEMPL